MSLKICFVEGCNSIVHCKGLCNRHYRRLSQKGRDVSDLPDEEWHKIKGWEDFYAVSNFGRVKSLEREVTHKKGRHSGASYRFREKILKPIITGRGYVAVHLSKNDRPHRVYIHRLVAEAFIENPDNLPEVNHINGVKNDNRVDNLEWCTKEENATHRYYVLEEKTGSFPARPVLDTVSGITYGSLAKAQLATGIDRHKIKEQWLRGERWESTTYKTC